MVAHIVVGVLAYLAQQEAARISERAKAGLQRARSRPSRQGRDSGCAQTTARNPAKETIAKHHS
ncbi:hypothetical protein H6F90_08010 [Trichocoleus sp. FACHB-591]|nr:hypothetical protein [Trichocoleus sp. FACHB-591]